MFHASFIAFVFCLLFHFACCAPVDHSSSSSSSSELTKEKTLQITQKWLIDNINLLRREMNEIARDYNQHVDSSKAEEVRKEVEFVRDVSSLRADHTILAQTLEQVMSMLKNNQKVTQSSESNLSGESNEISSGVTPHVRHGKEKHHLKKLINGLIKQEKKLKEETEKSVGEISEKVSALNELTSSLFRELNSVKQKLYDSSDD